MKIADKYQKMLKYSVFIKELRFVLLNRNDTFYLSDQ